jgi:hypothetical protein
MFLSWRGMSAVEPAGVVGDVRLCKLPMDCHCIPYFAGVDERAAYENNLVRNKLFSVNQINPVSWYHRPLPPDVMTNENVSATLPSRNLSVHSPNDDPHLQGCAPVVVRNVTHSARRYVTEGYAAGQYGPNAFRSS